MITRELPHGSICERAVIEAAAKLRGKRDQKLKGNQAKAVTLIWMFEILNNSRCYTSESIIPTRYANEPSNPHNNQMMCSFVEI